MRRTKWQLSFLIFIISTVFNLLVNAATVTADEENVKKTITISLTTTTKHSGKHHTITTKHHHKKHHHKKDDSSVHHARPTTTINNCFLAHHKPKTTTRHRTKTVYVCKTKTTTKLTTKKTHSSKHGQKNHNKKKTTSKKHHSTTKAHLTKKKSVSSKKPSSSKKETTSKKSTTKKSTTKKTTTTTTTTTKPTQKKTVNKAVVTTTAETHIPTTTTSHKLSVTTTIPIVVPYAIPTNEDNNTDSASDDSNNNDDHVPILPTTPTAVAAGANSIPTSISPADNNNQVNAQTVDTPDKNSDAQPQSKVIGVSIGAVVGCIAAAGLAGMFIYRRREKNGQQQDVEDLNQTSEVNTRWRTQSFMAVVAGAVAKLPKRSNSSASSNGRNSNFNVMGSIRRAASNASRSLSVRSQRSTRSSVQSYGIAVSGPIPPITRIDGDQAQYFGEPTSPTATGVHHTHAY